MMAFHQEDREWVAYEDVGMFDFHGNEAYWEIDGFYFERATVSGNGMTGTFFEAPFSANRVSTDGNPFAGTWRGTLDGFRFELVVGDTTWAFRTL